MGDYEISIDRIICLGQPAHFADLYQGMARLPDTVQDPRLSPGFEAKTS